MQEFNQITIYVLILSHTIISIMIASIATLILKKRYIDKEIKIFFLIFILNFTIVLFGYMLSLWLIYYLNKTKQAKQIDNIKSLNIDQIYEDFPIIKRSFGESFLPKIAQINSPNKIKAAVFMSENISKEFISIFKKLLADNSDEIRLYSFATLSSFEKSINDKIDSILDKLQDATSIERANYALTLAYLYWDLIYYDLIDKELKSSTLDQIRKYIAIASMQISCREDLVPLVAKLSLYTKDLEKAKEMFLKSLEFGYDKDTILIYLAQIEYELKNYKNVKIILSNLDNHQKINLIKNIKSQWIRE